MVDTWTRRTSVRYVSGCREHKRARRGSHGLSRRMFMESGEAAIAWTALAETGRERERPQCRTSEMLASSGNTSGRPENSARQKRGQGNLPTGELDKIDLRFQHVSVNRVELERWPRRHETARSKQASLTRVPTAFCACASRRCRAWLRSGAREESPAMSGLGQPLDGASPCSDASESVSAMM